MKRARREPAPYQTHGQQPPLPWGFGDPLGTLWGPGGAGSAGARYFCSLSLHPLGRGTVLPRLRPCRPSQPRLSPAVVLYVLGSSVTAHVVPAAACSRRRGFAGLARLLSRLRRGMAAGAGRLSCAAHMENTLSNHKEWRWRLKKHTQRSSVGACLAGMRKLPRVISAGVDLRVSFPCTPGMSLRSRAAQGMSRPADVVGLDAPSRRHSPAGSSPPKHQADSPSGAASGGLINPVFQSRESLYISCCFGHFLRSRSNPTGGQNMNPESSCASNHGRWDRRGAPAPTGTWAPEMAPARC